MVSRKLRSSIQALIWHRLCIKRKGLNIFREGEKTMLTFFIGLFIGTLMGILTMSLLIMGKDKDRWKAGSTP